MSKLYAQLYSIRHHMQEDFYGTLSQVAHMGYTGVEFAGYYGQSAQDIKAHLDALNLSVLSAHVGLDRLTSHLQEEINFIKHLGGSYLVCPWADITSEASALEHATLFNQIGKTCADQGIRFAYHNHDHELKGQDGKSPLDHLLESTDPAFVHLQPDLYWLAVTGLEPLDFLNRYTSRCPLVHLKQIKALGEAINVEAGDGIIDFKAIMFLYPEKHYIYEQETSDTTGLDSLARSLKSIKGE